MSAVITKMASSRRLAKGLRPKEDGLLRDGSAVISEKVAGDRRLSVAAFGGRRKL